MLGKVLYAALKPRRQSRSRWSSLLGNINIPKQSHKQTADTLASSWIRRDKDFIGLAEKWIFAVMRSVLTPFFHSLYSWRVQTCDAGLQCELRLSLRSRGVESIFSCCPPTSTKWVTWYCGHVPDLKRLRLLYPPRLLQRWPTFDGVISVLCFYLCVIKLLNFKLHSRNVLVSLKH